MRAVLPLMLAELLSCPLLGSGPAEDYYVANQPGSGAGTKDDPFGLADLPKPERMRTGTQAACDGWCGAQP